MRISDWSSDVCSSDLAEPRLSGGSPWRMRHIASGKHDPELLLYAKIAKSQPEEESVAVPRVARLLIVPAPGQAELQAIVLIGDPKAMANGFIAVGNRNREIGRAHV